jgi:hypothetical protein
MIKHNKTQTGSVIIEGKKAHIKIKLIIIIKCGEKSGNLIPEIHQGAYSV